MDELSRQKVELLQKETVFFKQCVNLFSNKIGIPDLVPIKTEKFFRYKSPNFFHFQVLMSVRIVSAINASLCLINNGYTQETGVLIRTICEFVSKMSCAQEAHIRDKLTKEQEKILNDYFSDEITSTEDCLDEPKWWASMKSIHASEANIITLLSKSGDPDTFKKLTQAIYYVYSRYVHGTCDVIMEMFDGYNNIFRMSGMSDTPRVRETVGGLFRCVVPIFSNFLSLSQQLELNELQKEITEKWKYHINSKLYKSE